MQVNEIVLSKGVYQMIKNHLKQDKKLTDFNKQKLISELKSAKILPSKSFPDKVVAINTSIKVKEVESNQEFQFSLVAPQDAKIKNNKLSVLSPIGLALVGYNVGDEVQWEMPDGLKKYVIQDVSLVE